MSAQILNEKKHGHGFTMPSLKVNIFYRMRVISDIPTGYCMLTLGTGETVRHDLGSSISLLPAHCYAVLGVSKFKTERTRYHNVHTDVIDDGTERHIIVRDPWQHFSSDDGGTVTFNNSFHCPAGDADREDGLSLPGSDRAENAGLTTLAWDVACLAFDGIYVSWDPAIFTNQLSFHG